MLMAWCGQTNMYGGMCPGCGVFSPEISRRRQSAAALVTMTAEKCHPEENVVPMKKSILSENVILRRCRPSQREGLPTKGPLHYSPRGLAQTVSFKLLTSVPRPSSAWAAISPRLNALDFPTLMSKSVALGRATRGLIKRRGLKQAETGKILVSLMSPH